MSQLALKSHSLVHIRFRQIYIYIYIERNEPKLIKRKKQAAALQKENVKNNR